MISHLSKHATSNDRKSVRHGFTLVEILIVVTIIGLLVGMLVAVGGPAITRAREFAVTNEITQMSGAVESFKTKYGFYPPSFEQIGNSNQLLPYLNKIAPNHRELEPSPSTPGISRMEDWWLKIGVNLNQQTSLQFWLAGLSHNKQYPLTGGFAEVPVGFNSPTFTTGAEIANGFEREIFFDFDQERIVPVAGNGTAQYIMDHGKTNGDLFYLYRDSGSYIPPAFNGAGVQVAYDRANPAHPSMAYHFWDGTSAVSKDDFPNPNTFQLISFGMDGDAGIVNPETGADIPPQFRGDLNSQLPRSADNLCNFANGRLDKFITERQ